MIAALACRVFHSLPEPDYAQLLAVARCNDGKALASLSLSAQGNRLRSGDKIAQPGDVLKIRRHIIQPGNVLGCLTSHIAIMQQQSTQRVCQAAMHAGEIQADGAHQTLDRQEMHLPQPHGRQCEAHIPILLRAPGNHLTHGNWNVTPVTSGIWVRLSNRFR